MPADAATDEATAKALAEKTRATADALEKRRARQGAGVERQLARMEGTLDAVKSTVEDFEMTYRVRELGWRCQVSPTVPAYTDSMKTLTALWNQRIKWSAGTVEDLLSFGVNRLTIRDWGQQALGLMSAIVRILWVLLWVVGAATGQLHPNWTWWAFTALFIVLDFVAALKIPGRDKTDVFLAVILIPNEIFAWMRAGWFIASWWLVMTGRARNRNLWAAQYTAEGMDAERSDQPVTVS